MIWSTADNPKYESGKKLFLRICNELLAYIFQKPERAGGGLAEWLIKSLLKSASSEQQQKKQWGGEGCGMVSCWLPVKNSTFWSKISLPKRHDAHSNTIA